MGITRLGGQWVSTLCPSSPRNANVDPPNNAMDFGFGGQRVSTLCPSLPSAPSNNKVRSRRGGVDEVRLVVVPDGPALLLCRSLRIGPCAWTIIPSFSGDPRSIIDGGADDAPPVIGLGVGLVSCATHIAWCVSSSSIELISQSVVRYG